MDAKTFRLLKQTYYGGAQRTVWDAALERNRHEKPDDMSDADWAWLGEGDFAPNAFDSASHDELVARMRIAAEHVSWREALDGLILGCSGSWPRGRQSSISLAYAAHLEPHAFDPGDAEPAPNAICQVCGLPMQATWDRTEDVFRLYWGYAWNEMPESYLPELEERSEVEMPEVAPADAAAFLALLHAIDDAPAGETPGQLETRIGKAKLLPGTEKYRRYGILSALAELGILPNVLIECSADGFVPRQTRLDAAHNLLTPPRSDIVLPLAAWRGELGVDWDRVDALYPQLR
ncbi:MAG: hypothetical protein AAGA54_24195 [Myxococcota bacterium]